MNIFQCFLLVMGPLQILSWVSDLSDSDWSETNLRFAWALLLHFLRPDLGCKFSVSCTPKISFFQYFLILMGATGRNQICYSESVFRLRKLDRPVLVHRAKSFDGDDGALCVHLFVLQNYSLRSSIGKALILEPLN